MNSVNYLSIFSTLIILIGLVPISIIRPRKSDLFLIIPSLILISFLFSFTPSNPDRVYYDNFCSTNRYFNYLSASEFGIIYKIYTFLPCLISTILDINFSVIFDIFFGISLSIIFYKVKISNSLSLFIISSSLPVCLFATFRLGIAYSLLILFFADSKKNLKIILSIPKTFIISLSHFSGFILIVPLIGSKLGIRKIINLKISKAFLLSLSFIFILFCIIYIINIFPVEAIFVKFLERYNSFDSGSTGIKSIIVIFFSLLILSRKNIDQEIKTYFFIVSLISLSLIFINSIARLNGFLLMISAITISKLKFNISKISNLQILNILSIFFLIINPLFILK